MSDSDGRRGWRTCKLCKSRVPVQYMAIKSVPSEHGHWKPVDANWCARCAERRAEGVKDDDGLQKRAGTSYGTKLDEGFGILSEDGNFGEGVTSDEQIFEQRW